MRNQALHTNGLGFSCYSERLIEGFIETTNWISKNRKIYIKNQKNEKDFWQF